ncbi:unnamed protein product [Phytophthora lilii]|uniref:Unnamed protein product n=1 Tax=Phytophthora lilii TaxID=2077276 RepID=A0A9W6XKC1_9STRA|nr:unnamed protein product [Phytophthora lilii]
MLCCATSWISLKFRLHCESDITDRLSSVTTSHEAQALGEVLDQSSAIRQCVLEVVLPLYSTQRINSDNYYTSVQLLMALRIKGLYGRGTVRKKSSHFSKHVLLDKKDSDCERGTSRQGVSVDRTMVAASWYDSAIVSVVSTADASTMTTVTRQVRADRQTFSAPTCVKEYNTYMQGVDRLDKIRARFSLADGRSFKKWYKKLGLAVVDVARANAYLTRRLVADSSGVRDAHREFIVDLISELVSGKCKEAINERRMFYFDTGAGEAISERLSPSSAVWIARTQNATQTPESPQRRCSAVASKQFYTDMSRKRRQCVVCRWEGERGATEVTHVCVLHNVSLCQNVHASTKAYACQQPTWTYWEKYHRFYLANKLFLHTGKMRPSSRLYKIKSALLQNKESTVVDPIGVLNGGRNAVRAIVL